MPETVSSDHEATLKKLHEMVQKGEIDRVYATERLNAAATSLAENGADTLANLNVIEMLSKTGVVDQEMIQGEALESVLNVMSSIQPESQEQLAILSCLANFSSRNPTLRQAMVAKNAVSALLSVLANKDLQGKELQRPALIALINLSVEPTSKAKMIQLGVVETLLAIAGAKERAGHFSQVMAMSALMSLGSGDPKCVESVVQKGTTAVVAAVLATQHAESDPNLHGHPIICGLQLLCNLSVATPQAQQEAVNLGTVSVLLDIIKAARSPDHGIWALRVCLNLASNPELKAQLAQFGLVDLLLEILRASGPKGEQQGISLDILATLCKDVTAATTLVSKDMSSIHNYATGVEEGTAGTFLQLCACEILAGMTLTGAEARIPMMSAGCPEVLIKVLNTKELLGTDVLRPTIVATVNLSIEDDSKVALAKLGVVQPLINMIAAPQLQGTDFQVYALRTIVSLSSCQQAPLAEEMIDQGVVETMMQIVDKPELKGSEQQIVALEAMVNISAGGGKTEMQFCDLGAVETLVSVMSAPEFQGQAQQLWAVRALLNLSNHEGARQKLIEKGVTNLLSNIVQEKQESHDDALMQMTEKALRNLNI